MPRKLIIIVIVAVVVTGGYLAYKSISSRQASSETAEVSAKGLKVASGANSMDISYIADPSKVNFGIGIYQPSSTDSIKENSATAKINGTTITYGTFITASTTDQVLAFYKKQMGSQVMVNKIDEGQGSYSVVSLKNKQTPIVKIYKEAATTKFQILK